MDVPGWRGDGPSPKRSGGRKKESSAHRRQRRLRAEARTFSRLIKATQAAAIHHCSGGELVSFLREFLSRPRSVAKPNTNPEASLFVHQEGAGCQTQGSNLPQKAVPEDAQVLCHAQQRIPDVDRSVGISFQASSQVLVEHKVLLEPHPKRRTTNTERRTQMGRPSHQVQCTDGVGINGTGTTAAVPAHAPQGCRGGVAKGGHHFAAYSQFMFYPTYIQGKGKPSAHPRGTF